MIIILVCRANTADHGQPAVTGAFHREGGYPAGHQPKQVHEHSDAPDFPCTPVFGVDEDIPGAYPHITRDGTQVADGDAYLLYLRAYIP